MQLYYSWAMVPNIGESTYKFNYVGLARMRKYNCCRLLNNMLSMSS